MKFKIDERHEGLFYNLLGFIILILIGLLL